MAYPSYPSYTPYNPFQYYTQPYQPQAAQPVQQPAQTPPIQQIQNGGFISVRSIDEARTWPIAPGNSVTFKDENAPFVYVKTMGFSQLDTPRFEKFRLVKEEETAQTVQPTPGAAAPALDLSDYVTKAELVALREEWDRFKAQAATSVKKEVEE